jgi:tetratricopeptide (TPR) repeat protein
MAATERNQTLLDGIAHADRALELAPGNPVALEQRGALRSLRSELGQVTDPRARRELANLAERDFRHALAGDRYLTRARAELSVILYRRGAYADARDEAREAHEQNAFMENTEDILNTWALASFEERDEAGAMARCREGLDRFPGQQRPMFVSCELTVLAFGTDADVEPDPARAWALGEMLHPGLMESHPDSTGLSRSTGVLIAGVLGRANLADSARAVLGRVGQGQASVQTLLNEAGTLARLGERDRAVAVLQEYLARTREFDPRVPFASRRLEPLRDYPPFQALLTSRR